MNQLPLFSQVSGAALEPSNPARPDTDSERLLVVFRDRRLAQGARPQTARREVSQVRAVMREAGAAGGATSLRTLFSDLDVIARVLREPVASISQETGRACLRAMQRVIRLMADTLGRDHALGLATLDALFPARRAVGWHTTGTIVAGTRGRRRRRGPGYRRSNRSRCAQPSPTGCAGSGSRITR